MQYKDAAGISLRIMSQAIHGCCRHDRFGVIIVDGIGR